MMESVLQRRTTLVVMVEEIGDQELQRPVVMAVVAVAGRWLSVVGVERKAVTV